MFGCQIDLPIDLQLGQPKQESGDQNKTEYVQHLQARLVWVHVFACRNMMLGSKRHKWYNDHKAQNCGFEHGDSVWLHNPGRKKDPEVAEALGGTIPSGIMPRQLELQNPERA